MLFDGAPLELDVFCAATMRGSRQILHLYADPQHMHDACAQYMVADEFDHSFVYFETGERAIAHWKNKAGTIRFCGSAAYGLAWLAITQFNVPALQITSRHIRTTAALQRGCVTL